MDRRGFLSSVLALGVAPAIVRADSLMRVVPRSAGFVLGAQPPGWIGGIVTRAQGGFIYDGLVYSVTGCVLDDGGRIVSWRPDGRDDFILLPGPNGYPTIGELALAARRV